MDRLSGTRLAGVLIISLAISGCASAKLGEAVDLANVGTKASGDLQTAAAASESAFTQAVISDQFLRGLQAAGGFRDHGCGLVRDPNAVAAPVPDAGPPAEEIAQVEASLRARTALAKGLGKTYAAMSALASYDASGAVSQGVADVFGAANALRATWGLSALPETASTIISAGAGALAQQRQLAKAKAASAQIRIALGGYREALVRGQDVTVSLMMNGVEETYALKTALWRRGYLDANGLLARMGQSSDLTVPTAQTVRLNASDEALCQGVRAALDGERVAALAAVGPEYTTQIQVIDQLVETHNKFEQNAQMDTAHLITLLDTLTALARKVEAGAAAK